MSRRRSKRKRANKKRTRGPDRSTAPAPVEPAEVAESPSELSGQAPAVVTEGAEPQIQITRSIAVRRGPLPAPETFQAYENTLAGTADRLLTMAEKQQEHSHAQQAVRQQLAGRLARRGQWIGLLVTVLAIVGGVILVVLDKSVEGLATVFLPLASIVGLFVWSRRGRPEASRPDSPQAQSKGARPPAPPR